MKKIFANILIPLVLILLAGCASVVFQTPLNSAIMRSDKSAVRDLLDKGEDITKFGDCGEVSSYYNVTPLMCAAAYGNTDIAKLLIDKGANIYAENPAGLTPLIAAVMYGQNDVAKLLIEKGADSERATMVMQSWASKNLHISPFNRASSGISFLKSLKKPEPKTAAAPLEKSATPAAINTLSTHMFKSDVDELPSIKAKSKKNSYAIVIGIEQYRQKLPKADFATQDAKTMTEYLTKVMGYPEENVVTLLNDHAAKSDFEKYFEKWLWNNVEKDGSVFIYYSGHGAPNPKTGDAYLVPYDGDPSFIDETGYPLKRLYDSLGKLPAKEIVVALDSCFSGAGGRSVLAKGARPLVMTMEKSAIPSNIAVLSAASGEQISSTYEEKGHGLFTYFLLKGLKGEGDVNGDSKVEIGELFEYLKPQVERMARKLYNNEQLPQLIAPAEIIRQKLIER